MEKKVEEQSVVLVQEKNSDKLHVLGQEKEQGKLNKLDPTKANESQFIKIDKHSNFLENFFLNFNRQFKNPSDFKFFMVPLKNLTVSIKRLAQALKSPDNPIDEATIRLTQLDPEKFKVQQSNTVDRSKIDWEQFKKYGIDTKALEATGELDNMIKWGKSNLVELNLNDASGSFKSKARLSFKTEGDNVTLNFHPVREKLDLDKPYYGAVLTDQDKFNLRNSGHAGRLIEIKSGEVTVPVLLSVDKLTNELVSCNADKVNIPSQLKGVDLNETQRELLKNGAAIFIKDMTSVKGTKFNAIVQFSAERRGLQISFPNEVQESLTIRDKFLGLELSSEQKAKLQNGEWIYLEGMRSPNNGQLFDANVRANFKENKFEYQKAQKVEVAPTSEVTPSTTITNRQNGPKM